ncbi:MAG: hypothetical protein IKD06_01635 [Clostridia bacterium]|nr:hypothetical protein [Clostridia bacterium]
MSCCTFFGHSSGGWETLPLLKDLLAQLIEKEGVQLFYVGNHGHFDRVAECALEWAKDHYPHISYAVVLAYFPSNKNKEETFFSPPTLYPEGLEKVPPKFAISARNRWMIDQADIVITYVRSSSTRAAIFKKIAQSKGKDVRELSSHIL